MDFSSILLFILIFIIQVNDTFSLWKKSKGGLENYVIDVLFSNSLTIIRCNPYERQILRDISIDTVGYIKCSNRESFLPENHIESITLLRWNSSSVKCSKDKKSIKEEKTYLHVKHKAKNAFKKVDFNLIRVGSMGPSISKMDEKNYLLSFEHPRRSLALTAEDQQNNTFGIQTFSFKHRPILCRERQLADGGPCANLHLNLSYVCYYRIGVAEPPTMADMEYELKTLPANIHLEGDSPVDVYNNKRPKEKPPKSIWSMVGIGIFIAVVITVIVVVVVYYSCNQSKRNGQNERLRQIGSDTSNISNMS